MRTSRIRPALISVGFGGVVGTCARTSVAMESNEMAVRSFLNTDFPFRLKPNRLRLRLLAGSGHLEVNNVHPRVNCQLYGIRNAIVVFGPTIRGAVKLNLV